MSDRRSFPDRVADALRRLFAGLVLALLALAMMLIDQCAGCIGGP